MRPRTNLPPLPGGFVGRRAELDALEGFLASGRRLVTLVGPGGAGKTRLAQELCAAHLDPLTGEEAGGVWFCDLSGARTAEDVCAAVARALETQVHPSAGAGRLGDEMARRGALLCVLDNFEQVVEHGKASVGAWLSRAPEAFFLVTSREPLGLGAEQVLHVVPLAVPEQGETNPEAIGASEAVTLFVERARAVRPNYSLSAADAPAVAAIVRRLDGIPLAIELCAARMGALSPEALLERLDRRFEILRTERRDVDPRHTTLERAIDWSWELLAPAERAALAQLAVFRGGFALNAAEAVVDLSSCPGAFRVLDVVQSLLQKSLLRQDSPAGGAGDVRLDLYESVHAYAVEKLRVSDFVESARERHARHYLGVAVAWADAQRGLGSAEALRHLALEMENLLAVWDWIESRPAGRSIDDDRVWAALALDPILSTRGPFDAHLAILDAALGSTSTDPVLRAKLLIDRGNARAQRGQTAESLADYEEAHALAERAGDRVLVGRSLSGVGLQQLAERRYDVARTTLARAKAIFAEAGDRRGEAFVTGLLGELAGDLGDLGDSEVHFEHALALLPEVGDRRLEGFYRGDLAFRSQERGRFDEAAATYERAIALLREVGDRRSEAIFGGFLGTLCHERGDHVTARARYERSVLVLREFGDPPYESFFGSLLAAIEAAAGEPERARARLEAAEARIAGIDDTRLISPVRLARGHIELALARRAGGEGDSVRETRHKKAARDYLDIEAPSAEARAARRILERAIADDGATAVASATADSHALLVGPEGRWFRPPEGESVDLERRPSLRYLVKRLTEQRLKAPGEPLSLHDLLASGWPGERPLPHAGALRVYVALSTLRKLGLRGLLVSGEGGYFLEPSVPVRLARDPAQEN